MTTFTKEQLQQIEAAANEALWPVVWSEKKARAHFNEKITPEVVLELARIALLSLGTDTQAQLVSEPYKLAKSPEACAWISDGEGLWLGDCGLTWTFFDDGPNENGLKYCPSYGKKVSFIAAPAQESE